MKETSGSLYFSILICWLCVVLEVGKLALGSGVDANWEFEASRKMGCLSGLDVCGFADVINDIMPT